MKTKIFLLALLLIIFVRAAEETVAVDSPIEEEVVIVEETSTADINKKHVTKEDVFVAAPNFYAYKETGQVVSLNAYLGKIVVLNFWTTYDRYCLKSISPLNDLQVKYQKKGLEVVSVSIDNPATVREFLIAHPKIKYTILFGSSNLTKLYDIWGLPTTYILDKDLAVRKIFNGFVDKKTLEKEIRKLL